MRAIDNEDPHYTVARHFRETHFSDRNQLTYCAIEQIPPNPRGGNRVKILRRTKSRYIIDIETKSPSGILKRN